MPAITFTSCIQAAAKRVPLRDAFMDDEERARQQRTAFGNPYKRAASPSAGLLDVGLGVDEANEAQALDIG